MNESSITTAEPAKASDRIKILLVFAHPAAHISRVNKALLEAARAVPGVTVHDLYTSYPSFFIDVRREQKLLLKHDIIVLQHPFYWYSMPALLKEWIDQVLEYGWAYGRDVTKLAGKTWTHAVSTGGPNESYAAEGANQYSVEDFTRPFERTAAICGMHWKPLFVTYEGRSLASDTLKMATERYRQWLIGLASTHIQHPASSLP